MRPLRTISTYIARMAPISWRLIAVIGMALVLPEGRIAAALLGDISGSAQLSGVKSTSPTEDIESLSQDYTANWSRRLFPYWEGRFSFRYYNLGIDQSLGTNAWQREYQPTGDLIWAHPAFTFSGGLRHNKAWSNNRVTNLIRNTSTFSFASKIIKYPTVRAFYEQNHSYNNIDRRERDTREWRWRSNIQQTISHHDFQYGFNRQSVNNLNTGLRTADFQHIGRWLYSGRSMHDRLSVTSSYTFSHRSQTTTRPAETPVLRPVPFLAALFAYDPTADLGTLDTLRTLADGNTIDPAQPPIDIGQSLADRNLGVDFGFARPLSGLYVYTDRPSSSLLAWRVYISGDNDTWTPVIGIVTARFNTSFNRYEIEFPEQSTRYIKVVNGSTNDVLTVLVTEIEPWELFTTSNRETRRQAAHFASLASAFELTKKLETSADLTVDWEPKGDFTDSRNRFHYTLAVRHDPTKKVTQSLRFISGLESFKVNDVRNASRGLNYLLKLTPLPALDFSFAASSRFTYINEVKSQEANNVVLQSRAALLDVLIVTGETGYGRSNLYDSRFRYDTWTYRVSTSGALTRSLDFVTRYSYQSTATPRFTSARIQRQYSADLTYRFTPKITLEGAWAIHDEADNYFMSQDYAMTWNLSSSLSVGGAVTIFNNEGGQLSRRSNARISCQLSSRTTVFANYIGNTSDVGGQAPTDLYQVGVLTGF